MRLSFSGGDAFIAMAIAAVATLLRVKVFESWEQVNVLWEAEVSPLAMIGHPHMPRYMVAYPGFLLENYWPSIGFSLYVCIFFGFNILLLRLITLLGAARRPSLSVYLAFICTQLAMNGRGVIAWTGWLLCIWICLRLAAGQVRPDSQIGWVALSACLAAVSTGVFVVVVMAYAMFMVVRQRAPSRRKPLRNSIVFVIAAPFVYAIINYFVLAINKNVEFYGGGLQGVFNMLHHGMGVLLVDSGPMVIMLLGAITFTGMVVFVPASYRLRFTPLERLIGLAAAGGLFGFTVLTLAIPPLLVRSLVRSPGASLRHKQARGHGLT